MGAVINFSFKNSDGSYSKYTMGVNDETNKFGQNVAIWKKQTLEQRKDPDVKKEFVGNGTVDWTDGRIVKVVRQEQKENSTEENENPVAELDF